MRCIDILIVINTFKKQGFPSLRINEKMNLAALQSLLLLKIHYILSCNRIR